MITSGGGYAAGVDLWITQKQGYPQAPPPLGQRKSGVAHRSTASAAAKDFFIFKNIKGKKPVTYSDFIGSEICRSNLG